MLRHRAPEIGETLDKIVFLQPRFEVGVRVHVDFDCQTGVENHLHGGVEIAKIFRVAFMPAQPQSIMGCGFTLSRT